ncbi:hypothetical protein Ocin01_02241 [Orchesella cincta]|uniref:DM13 domain-containing protein n=1 Tax=Orchesella cincta TaxID=48709 RepID=A0A1D2NGN9_ORCCI|nr:hypothetical protein Ocin01_02241 [Orchesella cincta]
MEKLCIFVLFFISTILATSNVQGEEEKLLKLGDLISCEHGVKGTVYAKNMQQIVIEEFTYDPQKAAGDGVWFMGMLETATRITPGRETGDRNWIIPFPDSACHPLDMQKTKDQWKNERLELTLPIKLTDYETIGLYAYAICTNIGHVRVKKSEVSSLPPIPAGVEAKGDCKADYDRFGDEQKKKDLKCTTKTSTHYALDSCGGQAAPNPNLPMVMVIVGVTFFGFMSKNTLI